MIEKAVVSASEAVASVGDGAVLMLGGFLGVGTPDSLVKALLEKGTKDLTLIANDTGVYKADSGFANGGAPFIVNKKVKKVIATHIGTNKETGRQMNANEMEVELVPQGTLAERIRAAGTGLGGVLTPTGLGTEVEEGKQVIEVSGKKFLLEEALFADVAFIKAKYADKSGNLIYSKSARNFNPLMAMAAKYVVVEVEKLVEIGDLDPDYVMTPSIFIDKIVLASK